MCWTKARLRPRCNYIRLHRYSSGALNAPEEIIKSSVFILLIAILQLRISVCLSVSGVDYFDAFTQPAVRLYSYRLISYDTFLARLLPGFVILTFDLDLEIPCYTFSREHLCHITFHSCRTTDVQMDTV